MIDFTKNDYAMARAKEKVNDIVSSHRWNRQELEDNWKRYLKIWSMQRGDNQKYNGRADLKYPVTRRAAETVIKRLHSSLLPDENFLSVLPKPGHEAVTFQSAEATENLLIHYLEGQTKLKTNMIPFFRQYVLLGTGIVKTGWDKIYKHKKTKNGWEKYLFRDCPSIRPVDLFGFGLFPWTVKDVQDADMVFEKFNEYGSYIRNMIENGYYPENINLDDTSDDETSNNERLSKYGFNDPAISKDHGQKVYNLIESYTELEVEKGHFVPVMIHSQSRGEILMITENTFEHGEVPYASAKYTESPDPLFYGQGAIEPVESLTSELNDIGNQTMDNKTLLLNPIFAIDPNAASDYRTLKMAPGAKWLIEPGAVQQLPMQDITRTGLEAWGMIKQEILEASDSMPNMPSQMRGASRTATRDRVMMTEMGSEISESVRHLSIMMSNIMRQTHSNIVQNMPREMMIKILRRDSGNYLYKSIKKADVIGDYDFNWLPSNKTQLNSVQTQQLLNSIRFFAEVGVKVDFEVLAKKFYQDGLGIKEVSDFIKTDPEPMSQDDENILLDMGRPVGVSQDDDDAEHLNNEKFKKKLETAKGDVKRAYQDHMIKHVEGAKLKQQIVQQAEAMARAQQAQIAQEQIQGQKQQGQQKPSRAPQSSGNAESDVSRGIRETE